MPALTSLTGRTVLVTGASGFIGAHLCARLRAEGAAVHGVSRRPRRADGMAWSSADLTDADVVRGLVERVAPDAVVHLASEVSGSREVAMVLPMLHANGVAAVNLLAATTGTSCCRVVLAGSLEEPDPADGDPVPASPYAAAKLVAAAYARMFHALYAAPVVLARIFMVYGPAQPDTRKLVPYVTLTLLRGESPALGSGVRPVDWIYVDDVVDGLVAALRAPDADGRQVELGSGELVPVRDVVERIHGLVGSAAAPQFGALADRPLERVRRADLGPAAEALGWRPATPLDEGLRRTVAWYADAAARGEV